MADPTDVFGSDSSFGVDNNRISQSNVMSNSLRAVNMAAGGLANTNLPTRARANTFIVGTPTTRDYGDYTDVQKALNAAHDAGGGTVYLKPGTFIPNQQLVIYSNTSLIGLTLTGCSIDFKRTQNNLLIYGGSTNVSIQNIEFQNCSNSSSGAIYINGCGLVDITQCKFDSNYSTSTTGADIYVDTGSSLVSVTDCQSSNSATFFSMSTSTPSHFNNYILNNKIRTCSSYSLKNVQATVIDNNYIGNTSASPFYGRFNSSTISNNNIADNSYTTGIDLSSLANSEVKIVNNHSNLSGVTAINLGAANQCQVIGNDIFGNIILSSANNTQIQGNYFGGYISLTNSNGNEITGNGFNNTTTNNQACILLDNSNYNTFTGNSAGTSSGVSGADGVRFQNSASYNTFTGNRVWAQASGTSRGYNVSGAGCTRNIIVGNSFDSTTASSDTGTSSTIASNG